MSTFVLLIVLSLLFVVASLVKPAYRLCEVAVLLVCVALLIGKT